jgi:solute carrier family 35 protein F5
MQAILGDDASSKPFFLTYTMSVFLIIPYGAVQLWRVCARTLSNPYIKLLAGPSVLRTEATTIGGSLDYPESSAQDRIALVRHNYKVHYLGLSKASKFAIQLCPLWLLANLFAMYCLRYTTVGSATIITSTSTIWTLIIGTAIGVQKITICNTYGVITTVLGISVIAYLDDAEDKQETKQNILLGDAMALTCAISYSFYAIMLKRRIFDENRVDMVQIFALVGMFTAVLFSPLFIILDQAGIEKFEFPPSFEIAISIITISLFSMASDLVAAYAITMLNPLVVTAGLRLTIPLSLLGEVVLKGRHISNLYWVGASAVVAGVVMVGYGDLKSQCYEEELHHRRATSRAILTQSTS